MNDNIDFKELLIDILEGIGILALFYLVTFIVALIFMYMVENSIFFY